MSELKALLREKYKKTRREEKSILSDEIITCKVLESEVYKNAETLFIYCSSGTEADTYGIIKDALSKGKKVALPKCTDKDGMMDFYIIKDLESSLNKGMFSIMEPDIEKCSRAVERDNSVCIVPGLAFDKCGYRLGYGKGYYDRFLSKFKGISIGLCYSACLCDGLPFNEYDCKVDMIITDNEFLSFK